MITYKLPRTTFVCRYFDQAANEIREAEITETGNKSTAACARLGKQWCKDHTTKDTKLIFFEIDAREVQTEIYQATISDFMTIAKRIK